MKTCTKCGEEKALELFGSTPKTKDGRHTWCKDCLKHNTWLAKMKRFSITADDYYRILDVQEGVCAICGFDDPTKKLSVDHDHACCPGDFSCGKCIRGLLCTRCNMALGYVSDTPYVLENMLSYLSRGNIELL